MVAAVVLLSPNHFPGHRLVWYTLQEQLSMMSEVNCDKIPLVPRVSCLLAQGGGKKVPWERG